MTGNSTAPAGYWRQDPDSNAEVLIRAAEWAEQWQESLLALALLHSHLKRIEWADGEPSRFWVATPVDYESVLRKWADKRVLDLSYVLGVALGDAIYERTGHMPAWRTCADVRVVAVTNWTRVQAALFPGARLVEHNGLRFRSHTETRLAQALDEMGVMYFPCLSRYGERHAANRTL